MYPTNHLNHYQKYLPKVPKNTNAPSSHMINIRISFLCLTAATSTVLPARNVTANRNKDL